MLSPSPSRTSTSSIVPASSTAAGRYTFAGSGARDRRQRCWSSLRIRVARPVKAGGHRAREAAASALLSQLLLAPRSRDDRPARSCPGRPGGVADLLGRLHGLVHDPVEVRQLDTE